MDQYSIQEIVLKRHFKKETVVSVFSTLLGAGASVGNSNSFLSFYAMKTEDKCHSHYYQQLSLFFLSITNVCSWLFSKVKLQN